MNKGKSTPEHREREKLRARKKRAANPTLYNALAVKWREKHADRINATRRARAKANPNKVWETRYKVKIARATPQACEACKTPFAMTKHGPCLDHDHATGEFRGWLCHHCNSAIGYARDSRDRLQRLIEYLDMVELLK